MTNFDAVISSFEENNLEKFKSAIAEIKSINEDEDEDGCLVIHLIQTLAGQQAPGKEDLFKALVSSGCNLNVMNKMGRSPLNWLAFQNNLHYFQLLVELGADINFGYGYMGYESPIGMAIRSNSSLEVAKFLFSHSEFKMPKAGDLMNIAKKSGAKNSLALLKDLKIK